MTRSYWTQGALEEQFSIKFLRNFNIMIPSVDPQHLFPGINIVGNIYAILMHLSAPQIEDFDIITSRVAARSSEGVACCFSEDVCQNCELLIFGSLWLRWWFCFW